MLPLLLVACRPPAEKPETSSTADSSATPDRTGPTGGSDRPTDPIDSAAPSPTAATGETGGASVVAPGVGGHALAFFRYGAGIATTLSTDPVATSPSGSTVVVAVGRGDLSATTAPTDSEGDAPYVQLDTEHSYTHWPYSGTAVYALAGAVGGPAFSVSTTAPLYDETTLAMVEVTDGARVADVSWTEVLSGPQTSAPVTTDGPATLVAFWWGDADGSVAHTAAPDGGFTVVDAVLEAGSLVQCAVAVATVDEAGTWDVTWTASPDLGAQLWLVAVE